MNRRRRHAREIPFSFDSFLDIVANVVGVIIRLILVVWVGARSYTTLQHLAKTNVPHARAGAERALPADPLQDELARHRLELAEAQGRLLAQLRLLQDSEVQQTSAKETLEQLAVRRQQLAQEADLIDRKDRENSPAAQVVALSSEELRARSRKVLEEIKILEGTPPQKKTLRYRTPISRPLQSEELFFECQQGRVTFIDIASLLREVHQRLPEKEQQLRSVWEVSDRTGIMGAFRLRYTLERERGMLDFSGAAAIPVGSGGFRYGLSSWQIEPVMPQRGETVAAALADGSEFRQIADGIDAQFTAVTFWVYPDSFAIFRRLRDFLYQRDVVVAGRPLPAGTSIMSTPRGTVSRGQ
jgi:hypothetical protein